MPDTPKAPRTVRLLSDEQLADICSIGSAKITSHNFVALVAIARWAREIETWARRHCEELIAHGSVTSLQELDAILAQIAPEEER